MENQAKTAQTTNTRKNSSKTQSAAAKQAIFMYDRDNKSMSLLLEILQRQREMLLDKRTPDYTALNSIVEFIDGYHSSIQQPREELLFRATELRTTDSRIKQQIDVLRTENENLKHSLQGLAEQLGAIHNGEKRADKKLLRDGLDALLEFGTGHLQQVQETFIPSAADTLHASDWQTIQMKMQYLEQEEQKEESASSGSSEIPLVEEVKESIDEAAAGASLVQLFGAYAVLESTVACFKGAGSLRSIAVKALRGDTKQLKEVGPLLRDTATAAIVPYKNRVKLMKSLVNRSFST